MCKDLLFGSVATDATIPPHIQVGGLPPVPLLRHYNRQYDRALEILKAASILLDREFVLTIAESMPLKSGDERGNSEGFAIPPDILDIFDHPGSFENAEASNVAQKWYTHELYSKRGGSVCFPPQPCAHSTRV